MTSISYLNESERSSISVLRVSILPLHVYSQRKLKYKFSHFKQNHPSKRTNGHSGENEVGSMCTHKAEGEV
jgi:hypothetical protein